MKMLSKSYSIRGEVFLSVIRITLNFAGPRASSVYPFLYTAVLILVNNFHP